MKKAFALITSVAALTLSSTTMAADLGPACTEYFKQIDELVAANPQGEAMKAQYESAKKQMVSMPSTAQEPACKQASEMMKQAISNMPVKK
ncbi:DUF5339 family protein [Pseudomonas idahonensis]|uniref:DUF5339 family protein n=1 Tax=Pseudomonas idahonensis TaxID=2942628 RepID=UPI0030CB3F33